MSMIYIKRIFICIMAALMLVVALPAQVCAVDIGDFEFSEGVGDCDEPGMDDIYPGDVNGDGTINSKDINVLKKYLSGEKADILDYNADINNDSNIDSKDCNLLKQIIAGVLIF